MTARAELIVEPGVLGIDEAGRGPLAGPLVVAGVIIPLGFDCTGLGDSKQLSEAQREKAFERIIRDCEHRIEFIDVEVIDRVNILRATLDAMHTIARCFPDSIVVIDGNQIPPGLQATAIVKGDSKHASIAAASILAKCSRDRYMVEMALQYPEYGFERHKGYGGPDHLAAIREHGPCPLHRRSFEPVKSLVNQPCLTFE